MIADTAWRGVQNHIPPKILLIVDSHIAYERQLRLPIAENDFKIQAISMNITISKKCLGEPSSRNVPIAIFETLACTIVRSSESFERKTLPLAS